MSLLTAAGLAAGCALAAGGGPPRDDTGGRAAGAPPEVAAGADSTAGGVDSSAAGEAPGLTGVTDSAAAREAPRVAGGPDSAAAGKAAGLAGVDSTAAGGAASDPRATARAAPDSADGADTGAVTRRIPLLPWPFYGRRSLGGLGPDGLAGLRPGSPEHRLLELLDFSECSGQPRRDVGTCYFLEGGKVYGIEREPGAGPSRFRLTPLTVPHGANSNAPGPRVDTSAPEGPVLVLPPGVEVSYLESTL